MTLIDSTASPATTPVLQITSVVVVRRIITAADLGLAVGEADAMTLAELTELAHEYGANIPAVDGEILTRCEDVVDARTGS